MLFNPNSDTDDPRDLRVCRHSILERFRSSPETFYAVHIAKTVEFGPSNPAMRLGTAIDALVLTPEDDKIVVLDEKLVRSRDAEKKSEAKDEAMAAGKVWLTPSEYNHVKRAVDAVRSHPEAAAILNLDFEPQKEVSWTCPWTEFPKCGHLDYYRTGLICDLKTTSPWNIQDSRIYAHIEQWGYKRQLAMYREGIEITTGQDSEAKIIVVATGPPYEVKVIDIPQFDLDLAHQENEQTCNLLADYYAYRLWE
jgi:hypothetical protein